MKGSPEPRSAQLGKARHGTASHATTRQPVRTRGRKADAECAIESEQGVVDIGTDNGHLAFRRERAAPSAGARLGWPGPGGGARVESPARRRAQGPHFVTQGTPAGRGGLGGQGRGQAKGGEEAVSCGVLV